MKKVEIEIQEARRGEDTVYEVYKLVDGEMKLMGYAPTLDDAQTMAGFYSTYEEKLRES